jgi:hypothetical protein
MVDGAEMLAVGTQNFHVFLDVGLVGSISPRCGGIAGHRREPVASEFPRHVGPKRASCADIGVAVRELALQAFDHAAAVERRDLVGLEVERLVVIGDGGIDAPGLEMDDPRLSNALM